MIDFYKGKKVFVTGHTGFKGSWLCKILTELGAEVTGYSKEPPTEPSLHDITGIGKKIHSVRGDIRDYESLKKVFFEARPEIVFHLAAQPIVRTGYEDPRYTYETNVMGTVNILECVRECDSVISVLNVTTDKVYKNREWSWGYRENEELDGFDPYSNSKSCSELVTHSYKDSFFKTLPVSTARAGNVIGGGDFSRDRIIPDCVRAAIEKKDIMIRKPNSVRPYQHVLEPLFAYMMIASCQAQDMRYAGYYNVGPDEKDCITTGELADIFIKYWGNGLKRVTTADNGPYESNYLKLDCSLIKSVFGWKPCWDVDKAVEKTVEWSKCYVSGDDTEKCMEKQIKEFLSETRDFVI